MPAKFAAHLNPGDRIHLHNHEQTVTRTETWVGPTIAVYSDYTGDDPWLLEPAEKVTVQPAGA
jgi:hypothetical protein